jgi:Na+/H+ antiporter NhaA
VAIFIFPYAFATHNNTFDGSFANMKNKRLPLVSAFGGFQLTSVNCAGQ